MNLPSNYNLPVRASEHVLFELFYLKIFQNSLNVSLPLEQRLPVMILSLFCLTIQGQRHEHPITLQGCNTKTLSNPD